METTKPASRAATPEEAAAHEKAEQVTLEALQEIDRATATLRGTNSRKEALAAQASIGACVKVILEARNEAGTFTED